MRRPRVVKFREMVKLFARFGVRLRQGTKHPYLEAPDGTKATIPKHEQGEDIRTYYVEAARRRFGLLPDDGVTDADFYGKRRRRRD